MHDCIVMWDSKLTWIQLLNHSWCSSSSDFKGTKRWSNAKPPFWFHCRRVCHLAPGEFNKVFWPCRCLKILVTGIRTQTNAQSLLMTPICQAGEPHWTISCMSFLLSSDLMSILNVGKVDQCHPNNWHVAEASHCEPGTSHQVRWWGNYLWSYFKWSRGRTKFQTMKVLAKTWMAGTSESDGEGQAKAKVAPAGPAPPTSTPTPAAMLAKRICLWKQTVTRGCSRSFL